MNLKLYHDDYIIETLIQTKKELAIEFLDKFIYPRFKQKIYDYPFEKTYTLVIEYSTNTAKFPHKIYFREFFFNMAEFTVIPVKYTESIIHYSTVIFKEEQNTSFYKYELIIV